MASIYDSDTVPTDRDIEIAKQIFRSDSGEFDVEKLANEASRLRRRDLHQSRAVSEVLVCLKGDDLGQNNGLIDDVKQLKDMVIETHNVVVKNATTKRFVKRDNFTEKLKGGLILLAFLTTTIVAIVAIILK